MTRGQLLRFRLRVEVDHLRARLSGVPLECRHDFDNSLRNSPHATLRFEVGGSAAMVCYGRPFAAGRRIFGGVVPFEELWRTGADEATTLYLPFPARISGLSVPRGRYTLYTVPSDGPRALLVVNRSTGQSGRTRDERGREGRLFPSGYSEAVRRVEAGRTRIDANPIDHVEQLTIRAHPAGPSETLLNIEWERLQLVVPISV